MYHICHITASIFISLKILKILRKKIYKILIIHKKAKYTHTSGCLKNYEDLYNFYHKKLSRKSHKLY